MERVRLDRWLCAARVFKSRTQATQACAGGRVKVNDESAKPHFALGPGDRVRVQTERGPRILEVVALAEKRLSPALARELFVDHSPPPEPRPARMPRREPGAGRPTKRERRALGRFRGR
ncbi:MAG TPA: RNA-binding S4 domain-containing protein [Myxococcota bacterium]|nr:RNA-binding S4 domain-containing protein [Myxococcota bacterium]